MNETTTRRSFLAAVATVGTSARAGPPSPQDCSDDLLPALRARFGDQLHPDVTAARLTKRQGILRLEMIVGPNPSWAGAFCDFDDHHSCSELVVVNELTCPLNSERWGLKPSRSIDENASRLLENVELDLMCRMVGLIGTASIRQIIWPDKCDYLAS
jgi:hypothetical protein